MEHVQAAPVQVEPAAEVVNAIGTITRFHDALTAFFNTKRTTSPQHEGWVSEIHKEFVAYLRSERLDDPRRRTAK